ncbi:MAG: methylenetetrahydrofolate reductase C-terminal domain-containing protein, partial [Armatimonadetes bacterium]|nr:methylenetetrahydrofolate reductase C-terminal domain-containing protein [Armatimonadota bacterium]
MIIAERKPIAEILKNLAYYKKILIAGCNGCVAICMAGGEKEVGILAPLLSMAREKENSPLNIDTITVERQCEHEYNALIDPKIQEVEAILSTACGVGVQYLAERYPNLPVYPALNTSFMGGPIQAGVWKEFCGGCGNCILDLTGGICPIIRCSKSLLNGPCGGSEGGKCEVDPKSIDCAWQLIYDRLSRLNLLENLEKITPPKDWSTSRDGGPR